MYFERCVARVMRLVYAREEDDRPRPDRAGKKKPSRFFVGGGDCEVRAFLGDVDAGTRTVLECRDRSARLARASERVARARHFPSRIARGRAPRRPRDAREVTPRMTRLFRARARASSAMAGRALALLAFAASAGVSDAAYYYGRYGVGWGGRGAVRTTTVVRTRRGVYGRRLLQDEAEPPLAAAPAPALAPAPAFGDAGDDATECDTILDVVTSRPEFSTLASALEDLPRLREAMDSPERTDTFFAPTNDAIDALLQWGGFVEKAKVRERARRRKNPAEPSQKSRDERCSARRRGPARLSPPIVFVVTPDESSVHPSDDSR